MPLAPATTMFSPIFKAPCSISVAPSNRSITFTITFFTCSLFDFVFDATEADLNKFDKIIDEVEPGALRLPVLLKKYIKQNARLVAFNVDPLFNNAVDGLMYIKIADLPESTVRPVMEEFQAELERKFMDNNDK